jgi:hypothetical protein
MAEKRLKIWCPIVGRGRSRYFAAVQAGLDRNYAPMAAIFSSLIERSLGGAGR